MKKQPQSGFTLLELSIVLVIIGLIIGGVMVGKGMIEGAKRQSILKDFGKYTTAMNTFRLKYNALAGDLSNARDYWPTASGNSDGDGSIRYASSEMFKSWEQMAYAGIIEGSYDGNAHGADCTGSFCLVSGVNSPAGAHGQSGWFWFTPYYTWNLPIRGKVYLVYANANDPNANYLKGVISPNDALYIDNKLDDGLPYSLGRMINWSGYAPDCDVGVAGVQTYDVSVADNACFLMYGYK